MHSSIKIEEISMQSSFPKLRAEVFDKMRMRGLATANVDVQDRNLLQRRRVIQRAWTVDPKHFRTVYTEECDGSRSYSELLWRKSLCRVFVVQ